MKFNLMALRFPCMPGADSVLITHCQAYFMRWDLQALIICNTGHRYEQDLAIVSDSVVLSDQFSSELVSGSRILLQVMAKHVQQHQTGRMSTGIRRLEKRLKESLPKVCSPVPLELGLQPVSNATCSSEQTWHLTCDRVTRSVLLIYKHSSPQVAYLQHRLFSPLACSHQKAGSG